MVIDLENFTQAGKDVSSVPVVKDIIEWIVNPANIDITRSDEVPFVYSLSQNFPNPFNPITTIKFSLGEKGPVILKIYNIAGRLVETIVNDVRDDGRYLYLLEDYNDWNSSS